MKTKGIMKEKRKEREREKREQEKKRDSLICFNGISTSIVYLILKSSL